MQPELSSRGIAKWLIAYSSAVWLAIPQDNRQALTTLGLFMAAECVSSLWVAASTDTISYARGIHALSKKFAIFAMLMYLHLLETRIRIELGLEVLGAIGYSVNEAIATLKNFEALGVDVPQRAIDELIKLRRFPPAEAGKTPPAPIAQIDELPKLDSQHTEEKKETPPHV